MSANPNSTIAKIGNFFGLKVSEMLSMIASRTTVNEVKTLIAESQNTVTFAFNFSESIAPIIAHNKGLQIASLIVYDEFNRPHLTGWTTLDDNRVRLDFTEATSGRCVIVFFVL